MSGVLDCYMDRRDLCTPEEWEELHHEPSSETIPTLSPRMRNWLMDIVLLGDGEIEIVTPEAATRRQFERRPPAMGCPSKDVLEECLTHSERLPPVQQRILFRRLRDTMLRHLIPCDGISTIGGLIDILKHEMDTGIPSPVPDWYTFSTVTMGPRKIGYDACGNRGCFRTETPTESFSR